MAAFTTVASTASAQTARDIRGPSPLVAIESEPPAKLIVDPPLPEQLAQGLVHSIPNGELARGASIRQGRVPPRPPNFQEFCS